MLSIRSSYKAYRRLYGPIFIVYYRLADRQHKQHHNMVLPAHTELIQRRLYSL